MKSKELNEYVFLSDGIQIESIEGNTEYVEGTDFKQFYDFTLGITSPGTNDVNIISFTREQYEGIPQSDGSFNTTLWRTDFTTRQLIGELTEEKLRQLLYENEDAVIEAINEFIDDFESQNL